MKKFLVKTTLVSIPFLLMVLIVWIFDPLNYFGQNNIIPQERKDNFFLMPGKDMTKLGIQKKCSISKTTFNALLIGDSRVMPIDTSMINTITDAEWFNFSLAGCYTRSAVKSFFWAIKNVNREVDFVYWGHNFWGVNDIDRFSDIEDVNASVLKYITSKRIWGFIKDLCVLELDSNEAMSTYEEENGEAKQIEYWESIVFRKQQQVTTEHIRVQPIIYELIDSVANYCERHDIRLIHVYPPEYKDLLAIIQSDSITNAEYQKYLNHLSQYEFYNFNQGHWIESPEDFRDPMHPKEHVYNNIVDSIFNSR